MLAALRSAKLVFDRRDFVCQLWKKSYGQTPRHRRVPSQGAHHRGLPWRRLSRGVFRRPHPRPAARRQGDPRGVQVGEVVAGRRRRRERLQAAVRRARVEEGTWCANSRRCSRMRARSISPPTKTAKAKPSAGTCSRRCRRNVPVKRMVFHEITRAAIEEAVANPRDLDMALVDAQETRRILDRLYGWRLIEVLRRKGPGGATAGRVQSPAIRLLVERERARMAFRSANYWDIEAMFRKDDAAFKAALVGGQRPAPRRRQGLRPDHRAAVGRPPAARRSRGRAASPSVSPACPSPSAASKRSRTSPRPSRRSSPRRCSRPATTNSA